MARLREAFFGKKEDKATIRKPAPKATQSARHPPKDNATLKHPEPPSEGLKNTFPPPPTNLSQTNPPKREKFTQAAFDRQFHSQTGIKRSQAKIKRGSREGKRKGEGKGEGGKRTRAGEGKKGQGKGKRKGTRTIGKKR